MRTRTRSIDLPVLLGVSTKQITIGHVPIEISGYIHFAIMHHSKFKVSVLEATPVRSPLGGLEIKSWVEVDWDDELQADVLFGYIKNNYEFESSLVDESAAILEAISTRMETEEEAVAVAEDSDSDIDNGIEINMIDSEE